MTRRSAAQMVSKAIVLVRDPQKGWFGRELLDLTRFSPTAIPDALVPLANRPFLLHVLDSLQDAGIEEVALVVHPDAEAEVRRAVTPESTSMAIEFIRHEPPGGLGPALSAVDGFLDEEPFVLHLGDSLGRPPLRPMFDVNGFGRLDALLHVEEASEQPRRVLIDLAGERAAGVARNGTTGITGGLAGVAVFGAGMLDAARELESLASPELEMLAAVDRLAAQGGQVEMRVVGDWWRCRGQRGELLEANRFVLDGVCSGATAAWLSDTDIQGRVAIADSATLKSSTVRGPTIIGPGACLTDAYIGPYTSIGADVVVEGAEIEHSIVLPEATIAHLGARLEASVIGRKARVGRDFKLPRALRLHVGEGADVSLG